MLTIELLNKLADRQNTWQAHSAKIHASIVVVFTVGLVQSLDRKLSAIVNDNAALKSKVRRLQSLASETRQPIEDNVPCKKGCSNCCHGQVQLMQAEAELIGDAIGRTPVRLKTDVRPTPAPALYKPDTPCPFLVNHLCSVYNVRPMACRNHVVLDIDNLLCSFENQNLAQVGDSRSVPFPKLEAGPILETYRQMAIEKRQAIADIRQFFP